MNVHCVLYRVMVFSNIFIYNYNKLQNIILCVYWFLYTFNIVIIPFPLIKKQGLDPEILKNYRPEANLSFI